MTKTHVYKRRRGKYIMFALLIILVIFCIVTIFQYSGDINASYKKLNSYPVKSIDTEFGKMSFIDNGEGDVVLLSHGIFGGYD
jgi:hypothetical protein